MKKNVKIIFAFEGDDIASIFKILQIIRINSFFLILLFNSISFKNNNYFQKRFKTIIYC